MIFHLALALYDGWGGEEKTVTSIKSDIILTESGGEYYKKGNC